MGQLNAMSDPGLDLRQGGKLATKEIIRTSDKIWMWTVSNNMYQWLISWIWLIYRKSVPFLYIDNKLPEREVKRTVPLIVASKWMRYLGINVTKEVKRPENCKTLMKDIEEHANK